MRNAVPRLLGAAGAGVLALAGVLGGTVAASAAPTAVTAVTHVSNRPDGGHAGTWAYDTFDRTLTVTLSAVQDPADTTAGLTDYTAVISDHGTFSAILGAGAPNQVVPGVKIAHSESGSMNGTYTLAVTAPSADTLTGTVPAAEDDNFGGPLVTTGSWPAQAFASAAGVTANGGAYSWTYASARYCQSWTDSSANGDGNLAGDGNITGVSQCAPPPVPVISRLRAYPSEHGAYLTWSQTVSDTDTVTVSGPGIRHGHVTFSARDGRASVYGLRAHSWYTVTVQPTGHGHAEGSAASVTFRTRR